MSEENNEMADEKIAMRDKAIEAMAETHHERRIALGLSTSRPWAELSPAGRLVRVKVMSTTFDALHGIVQITPCEVTSEMLRARIELPHNSGAARRFSAMAEAGDLTRVPEAKL